LKLEEITPARLNKVSDKELLAIHLRLHQLYGNTTEFTKEDIINFHKLVIEEMKKRGMNHNIEDALDIHTRELLKNVNDTMVVPDFVSIVGSTVKGNKEPDDLDILIRAERIDKGFLIYPENIELPIRNIVDPNKQQKLHFIPNPQGAHDDYIPVFDLVLRAKKLQLVKLNFAKRVEPITRYIPQKPFMAGYTEFFSAEELWNKWAVKHEDKTFLISPKIDGFRTIIQKRGQNVSIWFEDTKEDRAEQLPQIVNAIKEYEDCIVEGELVVKRGNKFLARPEIISFLAGKIQAEPVIFLYDILYFRDDIHNEPFSDRYKLLKKFNKKPFSVLPQYKAKTKQSFLDACRKAVSYNAPVEGVVTRVSDMSYHFGATEEYAKFKLWVELKVKVVKIHTTKNGYVYECALRNKDTDVIIGKTFVSKSKLVNEGEVLNVAVEELLLYPDGTVKWGKPFPLGPDKSRPAYTVTQAIDIARRGKCLKEIITKLKDEGDTSGEEGERKWKQIWYSIYPRSGRGRFVYQWHFRGLNEEEINLSAEELLKRGHSVHGDLRFEGENALWGFTVFLGKPEDVLKGKDVTNLGEFKLQGTFKLVQPKEWLKIGEPPYVVKPGDVKFFKIDSGTYNMGVWREHMVEIFIHGSKIKGRHLIEYAPVGTKRIWLIEKPEDQTPYAEKHQIENVIKGLREKGQTYLLWAEPGEKPKLIDVRKISSKTIPVYRAKPHYVLAPVLVPNEPDWYGDIISEEEIRKAATKWLHEYRKVGIFHKNELEDTQARVVDSFIAPVDLVLDNKKIKRGTWLLGIEIKDNTLWGMIETGKISGLSMEGVAIRREVQENG